MKTSEEAEPGEAGAEELRAASVSPAELDAKLKAHVPAPLSAAHPDDAAIDPLWWIRWLAILGSAALVLGRFIAPALPGTVAGIGRVVRVFELLGSFLTQFFALSAIFSLVFAFLGTARSDISAWIRLAGMSISGFAALLVLIGAATTDRVPGSAALVAAIAAGVFAVIAALAAFSANATRIARLPAVALGLVGAASVVRASGGLLGLYAGRVFTTPTLVTVGRTTATIAGLLVAAALALALVYIGRSSAAADTAGPPGRAQLWSPATIAVLVLAVLCARQAVIGGAADAGFINVVLKRASDRFLVQPEPYFSVPIRMFLGFLTPILTVALLFVRRVPALTAALCLVFVAADVLVAPLGAITLMLASIAVLLVARSGHVLWSSLAAPRA